MAVGRPSRLERWLRRSLLGAGMLLFLALSIQRIHSADFWWQLRTGQWVVQHLAVPQHDEFTYTVPSHEWIEMRWLFFALSYLGWSLGGPALLILAQTGVLAAAGLLVIRPSLRAATSAPGALVILLAIVSASGRFVVRPEIVTFLMVCLFLTVLDRYRRGEAGHAIWALPLAQIVWTNSHTLFALGPILVWIFAAGELARRMGGRVTPARFAIDGDRRSPAARGVTGKADRALRRSRAATKQGAERTATSVQNQRVETSSEASGRAGRRWWRLGRGDSGPEPDPPGLKREALLAVLVTAACLVNPYGLRGATFPLLLLHEMHAGSVFGRTIEELRSPFAKEAWGPELWAWALLVAVSAITFVLNRKRFDLVRLVLWASFVYLAGQSVRNLALFAFVATWAALRNIEESLPGLRFSRVASMAARAVLLAGTLAASWYVVTDRYARFADLDQQSGFGIVPWSVPDAAAEFIRRAGASPQLFNGMRDGSYLAWAAHERFPIFIDGRNEVYGEPFVKEYLSIGAGRRDWDAIAGAWRVETAVLHREDLAPLASLVQQSPSWVLVHLDARDVVFVRDIPEHADLIRKYRIDLTRPWAPRETAPAETPAGWRRWIGGVGRPWHTLGMAKPLLSLGAVESAASYLERVRRDFPEEREARALLAQIERSRGREAAAARLLAGLRFPPQEEGRMEELLADLFRMQNDPEKAAAPLERAMALRPGEGALREKRARNYLDARDYGRAALAYREALRGSPSSAQLWTELGHASALGGDTDGALEAYVTALRYNPGLPDIQYNVGILLARKGDVGGATGRFREALRLKPDYAAARTALAALDSSSLGRPSSPPPVGSTGGAGR